MASRKRDREEDTTAASAAATTDESEKQSALTTTMTTLTTDGSAPPLQEVSRVSNTVLTAASSLSRSDFARAARQHAVNGLLLDYCFIRATHRATGSVTLFRIVEVELYANVSPAHPDTYTHGDPQQCTPGNWYFHKKGGTFKSGSFKGLDVTFGLGENKPVGLLLRSLLVLDKCADVAAAEAASVVEGPSLVVDALVQATGHASILELVGHRDGVLQIDHPLLTLVRDPSAHGAAASASRSAPTPPRPEVYCGPRVGLVPRTAADFLYTSRNYRYTTWPKLAKARTGIICAMLAKRSMTDAAVRLATGCNLKTAEGVRAQLAKGAALSDAAVTSELCGADVTKSEVIATLFGYCDKNGWVDDV